MNEVARFQISRFQTGEPTMRTSLLSGAKSWSVARFDPCGFDAGDTNLYRFVGNDPENATDPSGLLQEDPSAAKQMVIAAALGGVGLPGDAATIEWQGNWIADGGGSAYDLVTAAQIKAHTGKWYELNLKLYKSDYFKGVPNAIMTSVAKYYAGYGILIRWTTTDVPTPGKSSFAGMMKNPSTNSSIDEAKKWGENEPDWMKAIFDVFGRDSPSMLFTGGLSDADKLFHKWGAPDIYGITWMKTLMIIPDGGSEVDDNYHYDSVVAHEIGHLLGLGHAGGPLLGSKWLMRPFNLHMATLNGFEISPRELKTIQANKKGWLKEVPAPTTK